MKILLLDNYDSFTYNLLHLLEQFEADRIDVFQNDAITIEEVNRYDKIILSPGPGLPEEAGIMIQVIKTYASTKSIFGVCLGHQAIAMAFGGKLLNLEKVQHGVSSITSVTDDSEILFRNIPGEFKTGRYHSWVVAKDVLPDCFTITAMDEQQNIMAISHKEFDVRGVQFHPESILTEYGKVLIGNWLNL